ncbi:MAG: PTS glucose transporter subunit IIA [Faecalibacterium sp.]
MELGSPAAGTVVPMEQLPDALFSTGAMGFCCGIEPDEGKVYAPMSGKIRQVAQTLHAVGMEADGVKLLLHVGVDTVDMNGDGFCALVRQGQMVEKGELLLTMDLEKIRAAGHPAAVIMVVTNSKEFEAAELTAGGQISAGDPVIRLGR